MFHVKRFTGETAEQDVSRETTIEDDRRLSLVSRETFLAKIRYFFVTLLHSAEKCDIISVTLDIREDFIPFFRKTQRKTGVTIQWERL
jgi:hypothetical protein